ncbi:MAG TPA: T9SS type A sorting domain-containing protein [Bacteroidia bacterium]|nr:T9SS type A sorting domain-containing protein [Bacteroidia bacterium]
MKKLFTLFIAFHLTFTAYQAKADYWTQKADFAGGDRKMMVGFSIGTKGYLGTGYSTTDHNDLWEWDQATNIWTQKATLPGAVRRLAVRFSIGAKGYIGTGYNGIYLNDLWEWDQATNSWMQKANMGASLSHAVALVIGTKAYVATGYDGTQKADLWEWDQATDTWSQKTPLPGPPRAGASGFAMGNKIYVANGDGGVFDLWEWNQLSDSWTQKANFGGNPVYMSRGFNIGNWGCTGTGTVASGYTADFWLWDQASDTWIQKAMVGGPGRSYASSFSIGNNGYIGTGGSSSAVNISDFWEYTADSTTDIEEQFTNFNLQFTITPNPAKDFITIDIPNLQDSKYITITGAQGKKVYEKPLTPKGEPTINIPLLKLSAGVYFVELSYGKQKAVKKFLKE